MHPDSPDNQRGTSGTAPAPGGVAGGGVPRGGAAPAGATPADVARGGVAPAGRAFVPVAAVWWGLVGVAALLFGLGFGLNFGVSNENTYLVGGLRLLGRGLLDHDWLTTQTTSYHRLFAYPAAALLYLDSSGWLFAAVNVILLALGAVIVFRLVQTIVSPAQQVLVFVLVTLMALATRTVSVADSTLFTLELEPSTIGVTGFLLGMYLFVRGRYLLSGLAVAAGGIFHANYLLLAFPVFVLAHLILRRRGVLRPLLRQLAFPLVALLALAPVIVPIALDPGGSGTGILLSVRSPHHYEPLTFRDQFVPFLGWLLLLLAGLQRGDVGREEASSEAATGRRQDRGRLGVSPALALAAAMTALVVVASALTSFVYIPTVAQTYMWRLAPVVVLLCQIFSMRMVAEGVVKGSPPPAPVRPKGAAARPDGASARPDNPAATAPPPAGRGAGEGAGTETSQAPSADAWLLPGPWRLGLMVVAGECFMYYYLFQRRNMVVLEVLGGILLLGLGAWIARQRRARAGAVPATVVILLAALTLGWLAARGLADNSSLLAAPTPESQLYSWARTTDKDAVFLIPPDLDGFRLSSQRAVVVDWKSTPFAATELDEWYRRIDAVSGRIDPKTAAQATAAYEGLSAPRLATLADMYAASYAVLREPAKATAPPGWRLLFDNGRYRVFQTGVPADGGS